MFPGSPEADLIHMSAYFFDQGEKRRIAHQAQQLEEVFIQIGTEYDPEYLEELATELNHSFDASPDPLLDEQMAQDSINYLMGHLSISIDQAMHAWHLLLGSTKETYEEHKAAVLMACSAYESMLISLIIHLGIWLGGMDPTVAEDTVENVRSTKQMFAQFRRWSGCSYDDAVALVGFVQFKEEWDEIKDLRNTFMHGKDDDLTRSAAAKTVQLLPQMVTFFAALNNHFAPKTP